jgi:hypothetical protein
LPEGKTCGDCVHINRCASIFGHIPEDQICDWHPIRFQEARHIGRKITIERTGLGVSKNFTLVNPPFPNPGDLIRHAGAHWTVVTVEETEILITIPTPRSVPE